MLKVALNNKRIAKNTLLLYIRMILILVIRLFTSRVVLNTLGVEDYGIYNVVGGIVVMFSFLNGAMSMATQRYLNFDLAKNDERQLNLTFNTSVIIHIGISIFIVLLAETIGLWFFYEKMVIPSDRIVAAMYVYQCSIIAMVMSIMTVPYNATIIAHEKMSAFAYISILEVVLRLIIIVFLCIISFDKLIVYSLLTLLVSACLCYIYNFYCRRHFKESKFVFEYNKTQIKDMGSFATWNLVSSLAYIGVTQGLNMILNVFFGPVINAARGVAVQVQGAIQQFATNFQQAVNPQITKSYALKDFDYMKSLVCRSSKFSFLVVFILALPILILPQPILVIWLENPPEYTASFLRMILLTALIDCLSQSLNVSVSASGKIRLFQLTNGFLMLLVVPLSYILLRIISNPNCVFVVQFLVTLTTHFVKLYFTKRCIGMSVQYYCNRVYIPLLFVVVFSPILPWICRYFFNDDLCGTVFISIICVVSSSVISMLFGLTFNERVIIIGKAKRMLHKFA